jgi:hypothetical protein
VQLLNKKWLGDRDRFGMGKTRDLGGSLVVREHLLSMVGKMQQAWSLGGGVCSKSGKVV